MRDESRFQCSWCEFRFGSECWKGHDLKEYCEMHVDPANPKQQKRCPDYKIANAWKEAQVK